MQNIKEYVAEQKLKIKTAVEKLEQKPKLVIIKVGYVEASSRYVKNKLKDCEEVKIPAELIQFEDTVTEAALLAKIEELNNDDSVTGFIVQLPLPKHIRESAVIEAIRPEKDVDGFSKLAFVNPGTPQGILDYLEAQNYDFQNKNAVVLGRSNIVGMPLSRMLLAKNCNVTTLHSKTSETNKRLYLENADIIFAATGVRHLIDSTYKLKPEAIVIDFGMNFDENGKLCGDCDFDLPVAFQASGAGKTGLTTRLAIITNLLKLYSLSKN